MNHSWFSTKFCSWVLPIVDVIFFEPLAQDSVVSFVWSTMNYLWLLRNSVWSYMLNVNFFCWFYPAPLSTVWIMLETGRNTTNEWMLYEINVMVYFQPGEWMRMMYYSRKWHRHRIIHHSHSFTRLEIYHHIYFIYHMLDIQILAVCSAFVQWT